MVLYILFHQRSVDIICKIRRSQMSDFTTITSLVGIELLSDKVMKEILRKLWSTSYFLQRTTRFPFNKINVSYGLDKTRLNKVELHLISHLRIFSF